MSSSKLPGSALYFFEEHREQYLHPSAGNECVVRVLADHEPSIATLWDSVMVATGPGEIGKWLATFLRARSGRDRHWRVVVQRKPAGRVIPNFSTMGRTSRPCECTVAFGDRRDDIDSPGERRRLPRLVNRHYGRRSRGAALPGSFSDPCLDGSRDERRVRRPCRWRRRAALRRYGDGDYGSLSYSSTST